MIVNITDEQRRALLDVAGSAQREPHLHGARATVVGKELVLRLPLHQVVGGDVVSNPREGLGPCYSLELSSGVRVNVNAEDFERIRYERFGEPKPEAPYALRRTYDNTLDLSQGELEAVDKFLAAIDDNALPGDASVVISAFCSNMLGHFFKARLKAKVKT